MATLQTTTASNWPAIDPDTVNKVKRIIDDYEFVGNWGTLTVAIRDEDTDEPQLALYGNCGFEASKPIYEDGVPIDREHGYTEEFLTRLAPHLEEQLVVETVGHEKCRYPLIASQWAVWPDGSIKYDVFDHSPEKPAPDDQENDAQYGVLNTDRNVFLKLGQWGPTLTSHREKAAKKAQGEYNDHLELVRIETTPISPE